MKDKAKQYISMKEMLTKRSFEPITNCNCSKDKEGAFVDLLNQEIEAMKYFANKNAVSILDIVNTCGVQKQIEEMAKVLSNRIINKTWRAEKVAKELYEIAVPKDSVVLSREEICELKCQAEEDFNKAYDLGSKKTAEKILKLTKEKCKELENKYSHLCKSKRECLEETCRYGGVLAVKRELYELAKQFGVEIKE